MKRISKNFLSIFLSDVLSHFLGFIGTVFIARILAVEGFGRISYGLAFLTYALLFGNLGLTTIGAREIARDRNNLRIIWGITGLRLFLAVIIIVVIAFGLFILPGEVVKRKIILFYILTLIPAAFLLEFVFQGREEMEYIGFSRLIQYGSYILLLFFLIQNQNQILFVPISYLISYFIMTSFLIIVFLKKYKKLKIVVSLGFYHHLLKLAIPIGVATLLYQVAMNLAPLILGIFHNEFEVGLFSAGYKIITVLLIVERVAYYISFPVFPRQFVRSPEKLLRSFQIFSQLVLFITIPITILGMILSSNILNIIYGKEYTIAANTLRLLFLYYAIAPLNTIWGYGLISINQEKVFFRIISFVALINISLTGILGFFLKGPGIGIAIFISEFVGIIFMKKALSRYFKFNLWQKPDKKIIRRLKNLIFSSE